METKMDIPASTIYENEEYYQYLVRSILTKRVYIPVSSISKSEEYYQRLVRPNLKNFPSQLIQSISEDNFFCLLCFKQFKYRKNGTKHCREKHAGREEEGGKGL